MKAKKPRHLIKKDGTRYMQVCSCCGYINCDPMYSRWGNARSRAEIKRDYRKENRLCLGCGSKICKCKNKKGY